jgi:hypothetical protein
MKAPLAIAWIGMLVALLPPGAASGARPWNPHASVEAQETVTDPEPEPESPKTLERFTAAYQEGLKQLATGRYREAAEAFSLALRLRPDDGGARRERARILLTLGYLTWDEPLVLRAQADIRRALQQLTQDRSAREIASLIEQLLKRMHTIDRPSRPAQAAPPARRPKPRRPGLPDPK